MKKFLVLLTVLLMSPIAMADNNVQQLLQLVDYIGVDYRGAVRDGRVINPGEYGEMRDFSRAITEQVSALPESDKKQDFLKRASKLASLVEEKADPAQVGTLAASLRSGIIDTYDIAVIPRHAPNLKQAKALYAENCASCHGEAGMGNGPLAAQLDPTPTDFTNHDRYRERTLYGLYNTITQGVADTAMQGFARLTEDQRWSLAFFVGSLAAREQDVFTGATLFSKTDSPLKDLQSLTTTTPGEAEAQYGNEGKAIMAYLRKEPSRLIQQDARQSLAFARNKLVESLTAYASHDKHKAYQLAVQAYLEGFELIENGLDAIDPAMRVDIERAMTAYRNLIRDGKPLSVLTDETQRIQTMLTAAEDKLDRTRLDGNAAFVSAMIILLREGLEALLVVAALAAFLVKTGRRDGLLWLYGGVAAALGLGGLTWLASTTIIDISGMHRELTEGIAALVAAGVLFYVGFWLHGKTSAAQWRNFINGSVEKALSKGTLWGLTLLSFIAVYREVLETVLFYQALWIQTDSGSQPMIVYGLLGASVILAVLAWLIMRYSARLPLRQFFAVTSVFMFVMAVVFAGKGVAALQEAGKLSMDPVSFPTIDILGIYPNMQGLLVQLLLVVAALFMWYRSGSENRRPPTQPG